MSGPSGKVADLSVGHPLPRMVLNRLRTSPTAVGGIDVTQGTSTQ